MPKMRPSFAVDRGYGGRESTLAWATGNFRVAPDSGATAQIASRPSGDAPRRTMMRRPSEEIQALPSKGKRSAGALPSEFGRIGEGAVDIRIREGRIA